MIDYDEGTHLSKGNATYERSTSTYTRNKKNLEWDQKHICGKVDKILVNNYLKKKKENKVIWNQMQRFILVKFSLDFKFQSDFKII
jgi:hypothetical protein